MANLAVIGTHWGDEGKGKVVDVLGDRFEIVARFQGGHNAGHTVYIDSTRYAFHLVPSGVLRAGVTAVIGNGVVVDPGAFVREVEGLRGQGLRIDGDNLIVSDRAHVITPWHLAYERESEERTKIGTTLRGVGPAYASKAERSGVRIADLLNPKVLGVKVEGAVELTNRRLAACEWFEPLDAGAIVERLAEQGERLRPFIRDTGAWLYRSIRDGRPVLFEGAQATLLDVDHGTYPYVTSSNSSAGSIASGLGIGPREVHAVLGVAKAYSTRVGEGPMPTELRDATGALIRERGNEYGVSTGRPRRCGWFDAVAARYAVRINGIEIVALTLLDVLDVFDEVSFAVGYRRPGGQVLDDMPADTSLLDDVEPVYERVAGWKAPTGAVRSYGDLPAAARAYVERLEEFLGVPVAIVSVGSGREATILREELLARWPRRR